MTIDHFPQLDTARLVLRGFRRADEAAFAGFATHEEFWRFLPGPALDRELVARFVAARVADAETPRSAWRRVRTEGCSQCNNRWYGSHLKKKTKLHHTAT